MRLELEVSGCHVSVFARGTLSPGTARPGWCRVAASPQPGRKGPKRLERVPHTGPPALRLRHPCQRLLTAPLHTKPLRQGGPSLSEGHVVFVFDRN